MFGNLRAFLKGTDAALTVSGSLVGSREVEIAVVSLLLETAYADGKLSPAEIEKLVSAVCHHFEIGGNCEELSELLDVAEELHEDQGKLTAVVDHINQEFNSSQKQLVLSAIWRVAAADGSVNDIELNFATQLRQRLGLTLEQALEARELSELDS